MRFELVEKNRVTLRIHWRLPFGRKTNKYGVLAIYSPNILVLKPDGKYAFTFILQLV